MVSRVIVTEPIGSQVGEIMVGLLDEAVGRLTARKGNVHEAVHEARKNLKAFRSYLRLLRAIIGDDSYRSLNVQARDAARILSGARDTVALHDAIAHVAKYTRRSRTRIDVKSLHKAADAEVRASAGTAAVRIMAREVADLLSPCRAELGTLSLPDRPGPYVEGLGKTYATAQRVLADGLATRLPDDMHEARKRVIHWRYQLDLFTGLWPRLLKSEVRELQDLREDLGQHNDLVLLESRLGAGDNGFAGIADAEAVLDAITVLRARRADAARYRGALLFVDTRSERAERLARWWQAALENAARDPL
ncbi:CHAD domain-containing protein [Microbaculum marinum]|uniref:CHAD domain-containing protein n=1 Tax=Microbaculum marinum TaxID=1764581 RepID=A0AAW9RAM3_9HYPH